jgi:hypothetical protein
MWWLYSWQWWRDAHIENAQTQEVLAALFFVLALAAVSSTTGTTGAGSGTSGR